MYNKIYIMGPVGSGKTTFATKLSKAYKIKKYSLDFVAWDNENGGVRRTDKEAQRILNEILKNKQWIIEDTGRKMFIQGRKEADII